jgi:hypothetical protein
MKWYDDGVKAFGNEIIEFSTSKKHHHYFNCFIKGTIGYGAYRELVSCDKEVLMVASHIPAGMRY